MTTSAQDRANATAKCPGSFKAGRRLAVGMFRCCACRFEFDAVDVRSEVPVAPWHRAVR